MAHSLLLSSLLCSFFFISTRRCSCTCAEYIQCTSTSACTDPQASTRYPATRQPRVPGTADQRTEYVLYAVGPAVPANCRSACKPDAHNSLGEHTTMSTCDHASCTLYSARRRVTTGELKPCGLLGGLHLQCRGSQVQQGTGHVQYVRTSNNQKLN